MANHGSEHRLSFRSSSSDGWILVNQSVASSADSPIEQENPSISQGEGQTLNVAFHGSPDPDLAGDVVLVPLHSVISELQAKVLATREHAIWKRHELSILLEQVEGTLKAVYANLLSRMAIPGSPEDTTEDRLREFEAVKELTSSQITATQQADKDLNKEEYELGRLETDFVEAIQQAARHHVISAPRRPNSNSEEIDPVLQAYNDALGNYQLAEERLAEFQHYSQQQDLRLFQSTERANDTDVSSTDTREQLASLRRALSSARETAVAARNKCTESGYQVDDTMLEPDIDSPGLPDHRAEIGAPSFEDSGEHADARIDRPERTSGESADLHHRHALVERIWTKLVFYWPPWRRAR